MARRKKKRTRNPSKGEHKKQAKRDLERWRQDLERAEGHLRDEEPGRALQEVALSLAAASCARCEAENAGEPELSRDAAQAMRDAGDVLLKSVAQIQVLAGSDVLVANPNGRHPSGTPNFLIRAHSSSLLAGSKDIYLVVNSDGEVMDAVVTSSEDYGPIQASIYSGLATLDLDVSGAQYRKLLKLAKQLQTVFASRPAFRPPARGGALARRATDRPLARMTPRRVAANPLKSKLMR